MRFSSSLAKRCYSIEPRDCIFVKGYGFLYFAKNIGKNISKSVNKILSGKCSQKLIDHAKESAPDVLKAASKRTL